MVDLAPRGPCRSTLSNSASVNENRVRSRLRTSAAFRAVVSARVLNASALAAGLEMTATPYDAPSGRARALRAAERKQTRSIVWVACKTHRSPDTAAKQAERITLRARIPHESTTRKTRSVTAKKESMVENPNSP